jgi:eukaryotic-like serine/threonine-protein kinase
MVTGELPFRSNGPLDAWMKKIQNDLTPPRELVPALSERLQWAILRAMSSDPSMRPATCREFIEDLTGRSTRRSTTQEVISPAQDLWFLVYKDENGEGHTVKGTTGAIRRSLKDGLLGDASNVRASRTKAGPFELLRTFPEFRDLVVQTSLGAGPAAASSATEVDTKGKRATSRTPVANVGSKETPMPHIALGDSANPTPSAKEWLLWILLPLVFGGSAVAAYYYFFMHR